VSDLEATTVGNPDLQGQGPQADEDVISPLGHRTVEERLIEELRQAIVTGSLKPGDRLAYRDLARRFGVSVTPVRIALRELSTGGLVEMRAHAGARVAALSRHELEEIFVTRIGIEGWLAAHGAPMLRDTEIDRMEELLEGLRAAEEARDTELYIPRSWAFRRTCYEAARKSRLLVRASELVDLSARYQFLSLADDPTLTRSFESMQSFFAACQARDGETAKEIIENQLEWVLGILTDAVPALGDETS